VDHQRVLSKITTSPCWNRESPLKLHSYSLFSVAAHTLLKSNPNRIPQPYSRIQSNAQLLDARYALILNSACFVTLHFSMKNCQWRISVCAKKVDGRSQEVARVVVTLSIYVKPVHWKMVT
jgi:hypothetical protein